jgi:asparagine synthase (glutamine-hydrolysing)
MCGIAGLLSPEPLKTIEQDIRSMTMTLHHRGPDGRNFWIDGQQQVALGHSRLRVVDLHDRSNQPMTSINGRFVLSFNGELYNHRTLRSQLSDRGSNFVTKSDTEVLVEAISAWGVEEAIIQAEGMFAFAVWDCAERKLWICRDRLGIKPCYWMWKNGVLAFGSQIKAILEWWKHPLDLNPVAIKSLLDYGFIASPQSIFAEIWQVEPGQVVVAEAGKAPKEKSYWSLRDRKRQCKQDLKPRSYDTLLNDFDGILRNVIGQYMQADVPTGCFLSGGVDSSLVSSIATRFCSRPLKTFAVGFEEADWDESWKARRIATHIGSDHHELILQRHDALDLVESIPDFYDEPFADFSQLPTLAVCRLAREHVTVSLSGDGGDELFGGYSRYSWAPNFWAILSVLPDALRTNIIRSLDEKKPGFNISDDMPLHIKEVLTELPNKLPLGGPIDSFKDLYKRIMQTGPKSLFHGPGASEECDFLNWHDDDWVTLTDRMQISDMRRYMGDGILTKVDRASMSVGLEVRVPLLSEAVVDFAFGLPEWAKFNRGRQRAIQKDLAYRYVPQDLLHYPKMGFGFPIDVWLRTSLREWADDMLSNKSLATCSYIDQAAVHDLWQAHRAGLSSEHWRLWPVLMFVQWSRRWKRYIGDNC